MVLDEKNTENFLTLLLNIFRSKTLYLTGAGASAFYIKPRYDLYQIAKNKIRELIISPIIINPITQNLSKEEKLRFQIAGSPHIFHETIDDRILIDEKNMDMYDIILHSQPEIIELFCALTYSLKDIPHICPEYQILNLINRESILLNLNHDGLAEFFINKAVKIIPLHGTITNLQRKFLQKNIIEIIESGVSKYLLKNCYFLTMENEFLLIQKKEYIDLIHELYIDRFQYIVIIGYSFFKKNDSDIYDVVTYDLIRSYLIENKCKLIILDVNPHYVADIVSKTTDIHMSCISMNWSAFTYAFNKIYNNPYQKFRFDRNNVKSLGILYDLFNHSDYYDINNLPNYIKSSKIINLR